MSDTLLDGLNKNMLLPYVRACFAAAAGSTELASLTDRIHKAALTTRPNTPQNSVTVQLQVWWCVDEDAELHRPVPPTREVMERTYLVSSREIRVADGSFTDHAEIMEQLTDYAPEDLLKFAAFV